jgi:hypothetical protein
MGKMTSGASGYKDHLHAIGLITINFAMLESTIASGVWFLSGLDQKKGQIITAELSFKGLVALFSSFYRQATNDSKKLEELEGLIKKVMRAEEKRNVISHSLWAVGNSDETISRIKTTAKISKGLKHTFEQITVQSLTEIADEIADTAAEVQYFYLLDLMSSPANS